MTVCYFGNYNPEYARNRILINGLRQSGVGVVECQTRKSGVGKYWSLFKQHNKLKDKYDVMIVGFSGYSVMRLAKWLCRKPLVFDAFVSLYLSDVEDRQLYTENSKAARRLARLDKRACELADRVLIDTHKQAEYFCQKYGLPKEKFVIIPVGSDDAVIKKGSSRPNEEKFIIHWHGNILSFYSLETVAQAAELLKEEHDIEFRLIAPMNQAYLKFKELVDSMKLTNLKFHDRVPYKELAKYINQANISLGIFGDTSKARLVIPNKVYEAIACGKLVITARHEVIKEVFDDTNIVVVTPGDPKDLAEKILWLKDNPKKLENIVRNAYGLFETKLTPKILGKQLEQELKLLIN